MKIDFDQIRELLAVFSQTDISELTIEAGEEKITVRKAAVATVPAPATLIEVPAAQHLAPPLARQQAPETASVQAPATHNDPGKANGLIPITSPMVGTFYRSPSPSAPPFIDVGDRITVGQTVCIIEAMKLMNDMPAEVSRRLVKVCVESGTTVEYGQPLFMVDPNG